jgi:hypothetical protein
MWHGSLPAKLTSVVPKEGLSRRHYLALFEQAAQASKKSQEILAGLQDSILLQDAPPLLPGRCVVRKPD